MIYFEKKGVCQMEFLCPICGDVLVQQDRSFVCSHRHSFDIARQGSVNLLAGKPPAVGDNREMIAARRRFLGGGHYAPFCQTIVEIATAHAKGGMLLDAGCGEGYYTEALAKHFEATVGPLSNSGGQRGSLPQTRRGLIFLSQLCRDAAVRVRNAEEA